MRKGPLSRCTNPPSPIDPQDYSKNLLDGHVGDTTEPRFVPNMMIFQPAASRYGLVLRQGQTAWEKTALDSQGKGKIEPYTYAEIMLLKV